VSVPEYDEAFEASQDKPAFSNSDESEAWMERWCYRCANDDGPGCPLVLVALVDRTPAQWVEDAPGSLGSQYSCVEFTPQE
jgi:hypothetical protein